MAKNIIFDFDGTLADTLDLALAFGNQNQGKFSKIKITKNDFQERSMREVLKFIGLPWYKLPQFVAALKKHMAEIITHVTLFPGIKDLIKELNNKGFLLYILSSNSKENIEAILIREHLKTCFQEIISDSSIFGKHVVLDRVFKKSKMIKADTVYVGDEVRDYEACKKVGVQMVAVTWGWDSIDRLKKAQSLLFAESLEDLKRLIIA